LVIASYPKETSFDENVISGFDYATEVISGIRTIRKDKNIPFKDAIELKVINNEKSVSDFDAIIMKLTNVSALEYVSDAVNGALTFRVKSNEYFVPVSGNINIEEEIAKLTEELEYTKGFLASVEKKLSNEKFVAGAPEQVIANERKKQADALAKIATVEQSIAGLK